VGLTARADKREPVRKSEEITRAMPETDPRTELEHAIYAAIRGLIRYHGATWVSVEARGPENPKGVVVVTSAGEPLESAPEGSYHPDE
jgi:hypothetical protein